MTASLPARIARAGAGAVFVLLGLATIGLFVPAIPVLGELGPVLMASFGPWISVLSLAGAVWAFARWRRSRRRMMAAVAWLALAATLGMSWGQMRQISVARAHGVQIGIGQAFLARGQHDDNLKPETIIYARHEGQNLPLDIYRPKRNATGSAAPIFIYIHGGGWGAETLRQRRADLHWFARRGFLVMSFEYPLATEDKATWNVTHPLLGCALVWANANAARFWRRPGAAGALG